MKCSLGVFAILAFGGLLAVDAPAATSNQQVVYLVKVGDGGASGRPIGCGDSVVPVKVPVRKGVPPLRGAIEALLATAPADDAPARNFWKGEALKVERVALRAGEATIRISGKLLVAGACDAPRIEEQIQATARQFSSVKTVRVLVNGVPLAQALR
jgi:hypothetical protein